MNETISQILRYIIIIAQVIIFITLFRWLGVKGIVGLLIGFAVMGYLVISGNPMFLTMVGMLSKNKQEKVKYIKRKWL